MSLAVDLRCVGTINKEEQGDSGPLRSLADLAHVLLYKLALKHRQGKNHKMRIIAFVGSPVEDNEKDVSLGQLLTCGNRVCGPLGEPGGGIGVRTLGKGGSAELRAAVGCTSLHAVEQASFLSPSSQLVKLAKRLKKEKVNVDIINFGEEVSGDWFGRQRLNSVAGRGTPYPEDCGREAADEDGWQGMGWAGRRAPCAFRPPGGEHREADRLCEHTEWQRRDRLSSGDGAAGAQPGGCPHQFSDSGWGRRGHAGAWCQ